MKRKHFGTGGEIAYFIEEIRDSFYAELWEGIDLKGAGSMYCIEKIEGLRLKLAVLKKELHRVDKFQKRYPERVEELRT